MKENGNSIKYGECRCCSNVGQHRDLMLEYEWNGTREVYFDTFLECFNLFLSTNPKKGNLICTSCILRLRDANSFKKMVTEAEENLLSYDVLNQDNSIVLLQTEELDLQDEQHLVEIKNEKSDVKSESSKFEQNGANSDTNSLLEEHMVLLQTEELDLQDEQHLVEIKNEKSDVKSECSEFEQNGANSDTDSLLEENIGDFLHIDRRYACKACGQAFVQNCSLKRHVKTHHPELLTP
ncbi:unnamed protein product [Euphydryas editha]|uniref:ZAD domain-containing protein n=1 Tax=Euphydryas editha TaxID=104508 RepID=A0AAU9VAZ1_EUPED|nr:unnamed protein product [Euphydryas editha]